MKEVFYIFIGSGLGGVIRFWLGKWINSLHSTSFPFGTFVVNVFACFVLGFVIGLADSRQLMSPQAKMFWGVGFCGGFSTFSTFSHETLTLLQAGNYSTGFLYILASLVVCFTITFLGLALAYKI